jgi:DNA mismatch endonuclease (patch repair protein)
VNGCFWHGHGIRFGDSGLELTDSSECCRIPKTNREFWVSKIRRNKERDKEEQRLLATMGWHCITVWECDLRPSKREDTLDAIAFTLNHIFLQDRSLRCKATDGENKTNCHQQEEENSLILKAAEERHETG